MFHRTSNRARSACVAFVGGAAMLASAASGAVTWTFETSANGWRVADLTCGGPYASPLGAYDVVWVPSGGSTGGYIQRADPSSNCYFFDAPSNALGNLSAYANGTISFALRATHNNWSSDSCVILIGTSGTVLVASIAPQPQTMWNTYSVPLIAASFRRNTRTGPAATTADLSNVLGSLAALRISAEYGSEVEETTALDSVRIQPMCFSDLDNDGDFSNGGQSDGGVDINDLLYFLQAFEAGHEAADLDNDGVQPGTPDGGVDINDLLFYLTSFENGC